MCAGQECSVVMIPCVILCLVYTSISVPFFFFTPTAPTEIYPLSLHDALPICARSSCSAGPPMAVCWRVRRHLPTPERSEEHTSELQSLRHLVCRLLLEKKKYTARRYGLRVAMTISSAWTLSQPARHNCDEPRV